MSNRDTETQSSGDTEKQRSRDTDGTHETDEVLPLATSVKTLPEAVRYSLSDPLAEDCLFVFARALKAFEITTNRHLSQEDLRGAFTLWWNTAKPLLPPDADFDEWRFDFEITFSKAKTPLGSNSLQEAIRRADAHPLPPEAERYASPKLKRLVAVCYHLQQLQGDSLFFLSVRDAAKIAGIRDLRLASAMLAGLVRDGVLKAVEKGTTRRATRFWFVLPGSNGVPHGKESSPAPAAVRCAPRPAPPRKRSKAKDSSNTTPRNPTTYEMVQRKSALEALIKGLGHESQWDRDDQAEYRRLTLERERLTAELKRTNEQIAGIDQQPGCTS